MTILQAIALGIIQGITEFLPVSSSAHLILASKTIGWPDQGLAFDIAAHSGSLLAILVYLRTELRNLGAGLGEVLVGKRTTRSRLVLQIAAATVPVLLAGWLLRGFVATKGRGLVTLGITSVVFGLLLLYADRHRHPVSADGRWSWPAMLQIGLAQAFAVIPGTSRSGVTMTAGLLAGMSRRDCARFSFLLSVPVGLIVGAKDGWDLLRQPVIEGSLWPLVVGFASAAVSAYLAIDWLLRWLRRRGFRLFAIYRMALGLLLLTLASL